MREILGTTTPEKAVSDQLSSLVDRKLIMRFQAPSRYSFQTVWYYKITPEGKRVFLKLNKRY